MVSLIKIEDYFFNNQNLGDNKIEDDESSLVKVGLADGWLKNQEYQEFLIRIEVDQLEESDIIKM